MKITTLIENHTPTDSPLPCEHGLSFWIETCGKKLIFDTGATGQFIVNAEKLGINLSEADMVILSHGHDDHSGGFHSFAEKAEKKLKVYVGKGFFQPKFKKNSDSDYQYGGNDFTEEEIMDLGCSLTEVDGKTLDLGQGLTLFREFTAYDPYEKIPDRFVIKHGESYEPDSFADELVLGIETEQGLVIVTGCAHCGIINIVETIKERTSLPIRGMIGGLHLKGAGEERIRHTAEYLAGLNLEFLACVHCTGDEAMKYFKEVFGNRLWVYVTGTKMTLC